MNPTLSSVPDNAALHSLWCSYKAGNKWAFGELARLQFRPLYNYGLRLTQDTDLIWDTIQDLFLELWDKRETENDVIFVKAYLLKAFRHKLMKSLTRQPVAVAIGRDCPDPGRGPAERGKSTPPNYQRDQTSVDALRVDCPVLIREINGAYAGREAGVMIRPKKISAFLEYEPGQIGTIEQKSTLDSLPRDRLHKI